MHGASVVTFNGTVCDKSIKTLYRDLIRIAKAAGAITILDSHGSEFALGLESVPCMVKPNVAETEELLGCPLNTDDAKWEAVAEFHARGVELVALSLGERGAFVSRGAERFHVVPPESPKSIPSAAATSSSPVSPSVSSNTCLCATWPSSPARPAR